MKTKRLKAIFVCLAVGTCLTLLTGCGGGGGNKTMPEGVSPEPTTSQQVRVGDKIITSGNIVRDGEASGSLGGVEGTFTCAQSGCALAGSRNTVTGELTVTGADGVTFTPISRQMEEDMMPPSMPTEFAGLDSKEAEYAATAIRRAANARPRSGSVTQSSNVRNGITLDSVAVTAEYGAGRNNYSIRNGSSWSISTSDGNPRQLDTSASLDGQELSKRTNGGTLYVDVYSDIEAPSSQEVSGSGVPRDVKSGDTVSGFTCVGSTCPTDSQKGMLNGVSGEFSCPSRCSIRIGGITLASGGGRINLPGGTFNGLTFGEDSFELTSVTGIVFTPDTASQMGMASDADYLAGGVWLFAPDNARSADDVVFGAFADGRDPFDQSTLMALQGPARYVGASTGVYLVKSSDGTEIGYMNADVTLNADFEGQSDLGTISGSMTDITDAIDGSRYPGSLNLNETSIGASNSGFFEGRLSGTVNDHTFSGRWGGQFFGNSEADREPGSVGGTLGGSTGSTADGSASFVGVFGASKQ